MCGLVPIGDCFLRGSNLHPEDGLLWARNATLLYAILCQQRNLSFCKNFVNGPPPPISFPLSYEASHEHVRIVSHQHMHQQSRNTRHS